MLASEQWIRVYHAQRGWIMRAVFQIVCGVIFFGLLMPEPAYAYIDPGLGSMLLQGFAAGAISLIVFWRGLRRKIVAFFNKNDQEKNDSDS